MLDFDTIPADPGVPGREQEIGERIAGAHLAYRDSRLDVISEYYYVLHEVHENGDDFRHAGWFAIGMWVPWQWKPYVGVDRQRIEPGDPFDPPTIVSVRRDLAGVRWDLLPFNALKFEYRHEWIPGLETDALVVQCGFMF